MKKLIIAFLLAIPFWSLGQDPASIKWKQIETKEFRLIYPENYDSVAKRIGSMLLIENKFETFNMKCKPRRISIVLHNQSSMSNGWVGLGPRNANFFHTPMQTSLSPMDWNAALVLHEYRHVIQYEMLRKGFAGRLLSIYWGDIGWSLKSITSPDWFYEGDAVATETALSKAGRGRSPDFSKDLRAQLLEKQKYSYAKATCGSYKDYVPNHYILGYHLITYGRYVWNADLWRKAHKRSGMIFGFTPFSREIKKETGYSKYGFYNLALNDLKVYWENQLKTQKLIYYEPIKYPEKKEYTNYKYPYSINDKSIIALKSGLGTIPSIVKIDQQGNESLIAEISAITSGNPINTNGKNIVWVEEFPDIRWNMKSYSDVMICNLSNNYTTRLTRNQHYYAPSISPDGTKIIAVEVTEKGLYQLVIINPKNGYVSKYIKSPQNQFIQTPQWSSDNKTITCIFQDKNGKSLYTLNTETERFTQHTPISFTDISEAYLYKNYIIYTSEYNGINNEIYALDTLTKQSYQITNTRFGSRFSSISSDNNMYFSTYTSNGYILGSIPFDNRQWTQYDISKSTPTDSLVQGLLKDEIGIPNLFDSTFTPDFKVKKYRKIAHLINPHSWGLNINVNSTEKNRNENNISVVSQNKLGTMSAIAGYRYDAIGSNKGYATLAYIGFYPIIQLDYETGIHGFLPEYRQEQKTIKKDTLFRYKRTLFSQKISFPLNLSTNNFTRDLTLSLANYYGSDGNITIDIYENNKYKTVKEIQNSEYYDFYDLNINYNNTKAYPQKNIIPNWGQYFELGYINFTPILGNSNKNYLDFTSRIYAKGKLYLPGFLRFNGIVISGGYTEVGETNTTGSYINNPIETDIGFARGYSNYSSTDYKAITNYSINYLFPIACPEISIPGIVYIKRLKVCLFYDRSITKSFNDESNSYTSYGFEFVSEDHILNLPNAAIHFGIRLESIDPEIGQTQRRSAGSLIFQFNY